MDMEHEIPKKLGVDASHGDGEPPKTLDARYVHYIMYYFNNPEKRETIMGSNSNVEVVCSGSMLEI